MNADLSQLKHAMDASNPFTFYGVSVNTDNALNTHVYPRPAQSPLRLENRRFI